MAKGSPVSAQSRASHPYLLPGHLLEQQFITSGFPEVVGTWGAGVRLWLSGRVFASESR